MKHLKRTLKYFIYWFAVGFGMSIVLGILIAILFNGFDYEAALGTAIGVGLGSGVILSIAEVDLENKIDKIKKKYEKDTRTD